MIECICKEFPDVTKGQTHHKNCPYHWLAKEQW